MRIDGSLDSSYGVTVGTWEVHCQNLMPTRTEVAPFIFAGRSTAKTAANGQNEQCSKGLTLPALTCNKDHLREERESISTE